MCVRSIIIGYIKSYLFRKFAYAFSIRKYESLEPVVNNIRKFYSAWVKCIFFVLNSPFDSCLEYIGTLCRLL